MEIGRLDEMRAHLSLSEMKGFFNSLLERSNGSQKLTLQTVSTTRFLIMTTLTNNSRLSLRMTEIKFKSDGKSEKHFEQSPQHYWQSALLPSTVTRTSPPNKENGKPPLFPPVPDLELVPMRLFVKAINALVPRADPKTRFIRTKSGPGNNWWVFWISIQVHRGFNPLCRVTDCGYVQDDSLDQILSVAKLRWYQTNRNSLSHRCSRATIEDFTSFALFFP